MSPRKLPALQHERLDPLGYAPAWFPTAPKIKDEFGVAYRLFAEARRGNLRFGDERLDLSGECLWLDHEPIL